MHAFFSQAGRRDTSTGKVSRFERRKQHGYNSSILLTSPDNFVEPVGMPPERTGLEGVSQFLEVVD